MSEEILDRPVPVSGARIAYGPEPEQFGVLWLPAGPGPHPTVIALHGGYWRERYDLTYLGHVCGALGAAGIATWNVEYRRLGNPGGGWPGTFLDVAAAADHLRTLAGRYALDLDRVASLGHSAGGHLALWLAARQRLPADSPLYRPDPLPLRGAVALAPVADLRLAWEWGLSDGVTGQLLGGAPDEVPERYRDGSPADLLPLGVRQVLVHGTEDRSVPYAMAERYTPAAQAAGDRVTLLTLPGAGHFEVVDPLSGEWEQVRAAVEDVLAAGRAVNS